jgi:predicted nuclease of predicted toxin-antitoxin system
MPKHFHKHKLLFDENMDVRQLFPRLNEHFDVKHVRDDLHLGGLKDPSVYDLAVVQGRIILTINGDDFRPLVGTKQDAGVIKIPDAWTRERIDSKLTALIMRHGPKYFAGHYRILATEWASI